MSEPVAKRIPVVAIGASAGGIEAFHEFFEHTPGDSGLAFIVLLHLPINRTSLLPEILGRWTSMPIVEVTDGIEVAANHVYLPPAGVGVIYKGGRLKLLHLDESAPREPNPINMLFNSLATALEEDATGVVLSGTGSDGALGLKAIKGHGGLTIVQGTDGSARQYDGMPSSAIATGAIDIVAPAGEMAARILAVQRRSKLATDIAALPTDKLAAARLAICEVLNQQLGHDFSGYKSNTFLRRVARRMQVLGYSATDQFVDRLKTDRHEAIMLFRDLLIGVTSFFRDAKTFDIIEREVLPRLFEHKGAGDTIRAWVPGCATGEEVYSLAILLREHVDRLGVNGPKLQLFATDIDDAAIATARAGRYPSALLQDLSPTRLSRFFVHGIDGTYTVDKSIRELCTFSPHSLTRDPPFSRMDLVSCRNLLIYLDLETQDAVIPAFHYSLMPDGILLLGSSETISRHEELFSVIDRSHRIFQKRDVPGPPLRMTGRIGTREAPFGTSRGADPAAPKPRSVRSANWAQARVLDRFAPPYMVVTADGTNIQYSAHLTRYLELPPGVPSQNALLMARTGLRAPLREALHQAVETGRLVERPGVSVRTDDGTLQRLTLIVEPRREAGPERLFLVVFVETRSEAHQAGPSSATDGFSERDLEADLRDTREQLQAMTEEHDTALEELRSANEELHSVNEELQSTNEELETSKEEIQSINEELQTVNGQLASKVDELDNKNSDLKNLFDSTQVATIFLDRYMIVGSFTPAIASLYNLIPSDHGRPLTDIVSRLRYTGLRDDCTQVLQTHEPLERRVSRDDDAAHYLMRILPYRSQDSAIDGTIVTFVDVTSIVAAEQHQRLLVDELNHRVKNMLTVVISIAIQTVRHTTTLPEFEKSFMGRIHALTAAYTLLSDEAWRTVPLRTLLLEELRPFQSVERNNIVLSGPIVAVGPRAALALGMAIHELTTNAVKYGALSSPEGQVSVTWHIETMGSGDELALDWVESGGPPVISPGRRGFGMTLIERGLKQDMSASVEIDFSPDRVRARVRAPIPRRYE